MTNGSNESEPRRHKKQTQSKRNVSRRWVEHRETPNGKETRKVVSRKSVSVKITVVETWSDSREVPGHALPGDCANDKIGSSRWGRLPVRWKFSLSDVRRLNGEAARELDGDYILDRVYCDAKQALWEHTFPARNGLFRASLTAIVSRKGEFQLTAEISGLVPGPIWQVIAPALRRTLIAQASGKEQVFAGFRWPSTVELVPLFLPASSGSWGTSQLMGSEFCDVGSAYDMAAGADLESRARDGK